MEFSLLDMTPYSRETWFELISYYYQTVFPAPLIAMALSVGLAFLAYRRKHLDLRLGLVFLAVAWLWCGAVFLMQFYAQINWAGKAFGWFFVGQGLLLLLAAFLLPQDLKALPRSAVILAWVVLSMGLLLQPLSGFLEGRSYQSIELFGLMPAPTMMATLGFLLLISWRWTWVLMIVPVVALVVSILFALGLGLGEFYWGVDALILMLIGGLLRWRALPT